MKTVVITGASTGIGRATALACGSSGWRVFAGVRRSDDAPRGTNIYPLLLDVTDAESVASAAAKVSESLGNQRLSGLVNNAGIALGGPLAFQPIDEVRKVLEVNLVGALATTQTFLPLLGTDPQRQGMPGRVVNMSSVAGGIGFPFLGAYSSSKHGLEGLSEALRRELLMFGIDVIVIGPGSVATPIWDKAESASEASPYDDTPYGAALRHFGEAVVKSGRSGLSPERIAQVVLHALTTEKPKTRYAPVQGMLVNWLLPRWMPKRIVDRVLAKSLGLNRKPGS